ncbi:hypothetical protein [Azotobacter beijerinckii]|uniref:hypothetical protein n=1 Tax=Azotobacter beijerinckii TaxID=170623 RepID=UPI002954C90A|nr:hypothetical protein [Azotobacter beijerinckii]MDV7210199.1 hypothetical protein [Azotobacter beijerinckii]
MPTFKDRLIESYLDLYGSPEAKIRHEYSFAYLKKMAFKENDIFIIQTKINGQKERIGWIFPAIALGSREHNRWKCPHFSVYAKVGGAIICESPHAELDENTHIMIVKDSRIIEGEIYIENLMAPLMRYGYYSFKGEPSFQNKLCAINNAETDKITINKSPGVSEYVPYIRKLILELLPKITDPLSRFLSIYQAYELLMEKYFHLKINEHRQKRSTIGTIREQVAELSSERKLMNGVFHHCGIRAQLNDDERNLAKSLFGQDKDDSYYTKLDLQGLIYDIRNAIVHNYHKYELSSLMLDISERMELIFIEVLENPKSSLLLTEEHTH